MTIATQESPVRHPVVLVAAAAVLGALLGLGGVALVADPAADPPASDPPVAAPPQSGR